MPDWLRDTRLASSRWLPSNGLGVAEEAAVRAALTERCGPQDATHALLQATRCAAAAHARFHPAGADRIDAPRAAFELTRQHAGEGIHQRFRDAVRVGREAGAGRLATAHGA